MNFLKPYRQTDKGISAQVKAATPNDEFYINGPYGKGVELKSGLNIFMTAGTGILPFMDIFAYIARRVLKQSRGDYAIFNDESLLGVPEDAKILIYAHFKSDGHAVGLEFCELLQELCQKNHLQEVFTFLPIYSVKKDHKKLKVKRIADIIKKESNRNISAFNVCGSPSMNEVFELKLDKISEKSGLAKSKFRIL